MARDSGGKDVFVQSPHLTDRGRTDPSNAPVWVRQRASHRSLNWDLGTELIAESAIFEIALSFDLVAGSPEYRAMILRPEILRGGGP
jgi:hypothetical protein